MGAYSEETIRRLTDTGRMIAAIIGFQRYCRYHAIAGPEIDHLINHVWRYFLRNESYRFAEWELEFDQLELNPLNMVYSQAFMQTIPEGIRDEFMTLMRDAVMTKAISWYAAHDEEGSVDEFKEVLTVLSKYAIYLPDSALMLQKFSKGSGTTQMSPDELAQFRAAAEGSCVEI